jgi:hypothetical protein
MTEAMEGVVAQLCDVRERLAAATMIAMRAKADADQGRRHYVEASKGTDHSTMKQAVAAISTASAKAAKVARILDEAREHLRAYLNIIAPGSAPADDTPSPAELPSGEQLMQEAVDRSDRRRSVDGFLGKLSRNAENLQDGAKQITELSEKGVKIFRNPSGPSGTHSTGPTSTTHPVLRAEPRPAIDIPDMASQLIVAALALTLAAQQTDKLIRKGIARLRARERTE